MAIVINRIDEAIRTYDKLLLILSEHSVKSAWIEREVNVALDKGQHTGRPDTVLFPITIDESIFQLYPAPPWALDLRRQIHIGDFRTWRHDDDAYVRAFEKLLEDLQKVGERNA